MSVAANRTKRWGGQGSDGMELQCDARGDNQELKRPQQTITVRQSKFHCTYSLRSAACEEACWDLICKTPERWGGGRTTSAVPTVLMRFSRHAVAVHVDHLLCVSVCVCVAPFNTTLD